MHRITETYINQRWLIQRMSQFFPNCSKDGICFGVAAMRMQAILSGDSELFDQRLKLIHEIPLNEFKEEIENINRKRLLITQQVKNQNGPLRDLSNEEKSRFLNDTVLQLNLEKIKDTVTDWAMKQNKSAEEKEKEQSRREQLCYFNALLQYKINLKISEELSDEERIKLDILPFFNGVELYQQDHLYCFLNDHNHPFTTHSIPQLFPLISSAYFDNQGAIACLDEFANVYKTDDLIRYFHSFAEEAQRSQVTGPLVFLLRSTEHAITVGYDPVENEWSFTDANALPTAYTHDPEKLAEEVRQALSNNDFAIFSTNIFSDKRSENDWNKVLELWKKDEILHQITTVKTIRLDSFDNSLLSLAAARGDINLVQNIIKAEEIIPKEKRLRQVAMPPLCLAAQNNHTEILRLLLANEEDPNSALRDDGATALMYAVSTSNDEAIKLLLDKGANHGSKTQKGHTALHIAVLMNAPQIVHTLLDKGADAESPAHDGMTPLYLAVRQNNIEIVKILIEHGVDIDAPMYAGKQSLEAFAEKRNAVPEMRLFIENKLKEQKPSMPLEVMIFLMNQNIAKPFLAVSPKDLAEILGFEEIANLLASNSQCKPC